MDFTGYTQKLEFLNRSGCDIREIEAFMESYLEAHPIPFVEICHPFLCRVRPNYAAGMNVVLNKEIVDTESVTLDFVAMMVLQRDPANFHNIKFMPASEGLIPDEKGNFYFKNIY